jgi:hypothetical protein
MGFLPSELLVRVLDKDLDKTEEKLNGWGKLTQLRTRGHENRNPLKLLMCVW